jgi:hypothetical protein
MMTAAARGPKPPRTYSGNVGMPRVMTARSARPAGIHIIQVRA